MGRSEQLVPMEPLAGNLKKRAAELGISNAEAGRRVGLSERRYGNYVSGTREPDLATLLRIAAVLQTTPDGLLGVAETGPSTPRAILMDRLVAAAQVMDDVALNLVVTQAEAVAKSGVASR